MLIAAARNVVRGQIRDRDGHLLATSKRDANGEPYRVYPSTAVAPVVGYASRLYGTAGLERAYDAELTGIRTPDPIEQLLAKFATDRYRPQDLTLSLSLDLQREAVRLLGKDRGSVVMLDPRSGEVLAMASTPTYDASAIAEPGHGQGSLRRGHRRPRQAAPRPRGPGPLRARLGVQDRDLGRRRSGPARSRPRPASRDSHRPRRTVCSCRASGSATGIIRSRARGPLAYDEAVEVSCNIYFALTGLETGGEALASWSARLGFGAPIPFDLPTASSQITNGGGSFGGGFADDVELANAAYGQGETLATPLQMALVAAAVANRGSLMRPHLVTRLSGSDGDTEIKPEVWRQAFSPEVAAEINVAMVRAVEGENGRLFTAGAKVPGVLTAGKSGTAQLDGSADPTHGSSGSPRRPIRRSRSRSSSSRAAAARPRHRRSPASS